MVKVEISVPGLILLAMFCVGYPLVEYGWYHRGGGYTATAQTTKEWKIERSDSASENASLGLVALRVATALRGSNTISHPSTTTSPAHVATLPATSPYRIFIFIPIWVFSMMAVVSLTSSGVAPVIRQKIERWYLQRKLYKELRRRV